MDKLETLRLFSDQRWQQCLTAFLDTLSEQESHTRLIDSRTTLAHFFQDRNPETVSREDVEVWCRQTPSYHGPVSNQTTKRRRLAIRGLYDQAIEQGVY